MKTDPRLRFSDRVRQYVLYRPGYPVESVDFIMNQFRLDNNSIVADIGSGTGKFTKSFDKRVRTIYGVEPNDEMRKASEECLQGQENYIPVKGDAENTTLGPCSVDAVFCAQAFHWFDRAKAKTEFARILKKEKKVALIWNEWEKSSPLFKDYEELLKTYANDYNEVTRRNLTDKVFEEFFRSYQKLMFRHQDVFNFESLCGRASSASYCPLPGEPNHKPFFDGLEKLFNKYQSGGLITFSYNTELYYGII